MRDWIVQRKSSKSKSKSKSNEVPATAMRGRDRDEPRVPWFPVFDRQWGKNWLLSNYDITHWINLEEDRSHMVSVGVTW